MQRRDCLKTSGDLAALSQRVIINCTGYGARRDGIVIQGSGIGIGIGGTEGYNNADETPSRAEAEAESDVRILQELYSRMSPKLRA